MKLHLLLKYVSNSSVLVLLLILFTNQIHAQAEANNWYFGSFAGLNFSTGAPVALTDGALNTDEGCATISDSNGELLFYTSGEKAWDKSHNVMPNGMGLMGDLSSSQSAIIVPFPNDANKYYLFTVRFVNYGLYYSVVDMSLNGGLGDIVATQKNINLLTKCTEKIAAVLHADEDSYWVLTYAPNDYTTSYSNDTFYAYKITGTGIESPIKSVTTYSAIEPKGYLKISPQGDKIAICHQYLTQAYVYDFDNATGVVANELILPVGGIPYSAEFSPSGKKLYVSTGSYYTSSVNNLYQFDMENADIASSRVTIEEYLAIRSSLQLAIDGKIYRSQDNAEYLGVINDPEAGGAACNYVRNAIYLNGAICREGLPPFIQSYFLTKIKVSNVCMGDVTQFEFTSNQAIDTALWDFGDGTSSTLENPSHVYASEGDYNVILTVTVGGETSTDTKTVTIYAQPTAQQAQNMSVCDDDNDGFYSFDLTTQNTVILNGQSPNNFEVVYYASLLDYTNNVPINNPTTYVNTTAYTPQNIVASVRNISNRVCEANTSFVIEVFETPNPSQNIPSLSFCDNVSVGTDSDGITAFDLTVHEATILNGQSATDYTITYYTDSGLTNQIATPNSYQNTNPTETIYVQVSNNSNTNCKANTSFAIEVHELPVVATTVILKQCDDNLDGYSVFNLIEVINEISVNANNETITFHESLSDAENNVNQITNVIAYSNQTVNTDILWSRVENANGCYRITQINLVVSTTQIPNTFTRNFFECDDAIDGDTTNGISSFDFSTVTAEIQGLFPVGQQLIIRYYRNQADALSESNSITDITDYRNVGSPITQEIFIRVDSALDNDCLGLGSHVTLHVETVPVANPVTINEQCDTDGDGMFAFDTNAIEATILNGQTNTNITYLDENGNILPNPLPNPFTTATQAITVRVENTTSQDIDGVCFDETTINFVVQAAAVANSVPDFNVCDDNGDGLFAFDTSSIEATVLNGQTGMVVAYYDANGAVLASPLPNPFTTATQTVTVKVENVLSAICFDETTIDFAVHEQPEAYTIANDFVCDDVTNDGEHEFILSDFNTQILNGQPSQIFEVVYFNSMTNATSNVNPLSNNYSCTTTSETIYARIQNSNNTDCFDITSFEIGVSYLPIATQPTDLSVCDDESNDGFEMFNLTNQNIEILNGLSNTDYTLSYFESITDAQQNVSAINTTYENVSNPQTIYVRLENNTNTDCYTTTSFQLIVNEQPNLSMQEQWSICENGTVEIIADSGYNEYLWSTGEVTSSITVDLAGTYQVTAANIYGNLRCETSKTITVVESNVATITDIDIVDWTMNNNVITVFVDGLGDYEYSIDGVEFQDENQFSNVSIGDYIVYVRDKNGCGVETEDVLLLYYPQFFTPNGDGINDTWQLINAFYEPLNKLQIFDRYGKFIREIKPNELGWDGTYRGNQLPSSDYWFVLYRQNGKQYRGHFSLKR
ncbi:MAG: hypothetical protein COA88_07245 [Kordia sp.]|nr:MAG: hypothetical protein COA88_07245 [Kordia sp.]